MARVDLPVTAISKAGVAPGAENNGDATNNHVMVNDGRTVVLCRNSGAGARVLTVHLTPSTVDGQAITPRTYSLAAGVSRYIGPFETVTYGTSLLIDVEHAELKLSAYKIPF